MQNEKCKSCFECTETVVVKVRDDRGSEWRDSSVRRCANDQCWHIVEGTRQDRLTWISNVYDYKYFGDYELSPEQIAAVYEAKSLAVVPDAKPVCHLVWLQGRRAADDVEDYYEVARPGDKSVDGSDPFPVYATPPALETALSAAEPVSSRNDEAGYVEFLNEDVPYIVRDIQGAVAILMDLETRTVIGYRVYDPDFVFAPPAPSVAVKEGQMINNMLLSQVLQNAFFAGRGTSGTVSREDMAAWQDYDPYHLEAFKRIRSALSAQVQDVAEVSGPMREIFQRWCEGYGFDEDSEEDVLLRASAAPAAKQGEESCPDCDGYNCDDGCAYPDAKKATS